MANIISEKYRQKFHLEPPEGWLNDPNGLCYFNDEYHVFFQYSPKRADGHSDRGWGHYHGKNLFDMTFDKAVMMPDIPEDSHGVYSGSAVVKDHSLHIFYTGNVKLAGDYNYITEGREANVIHVTSKDASRMSKKEILLRNKDYPAFCSCHVRDPKVWRNGDVWNMVLGARTIDDKGCVLFYESQDLINWKYRDMVTKENYGYMWECPDYFEFNGKGFLSVCPQGLEAYDTKFQNLFQSGYFTAEKNKLGEFTEWDMGFDFYAPQTFVDPMGRRILIGWMGMDTPEYKNATTELGWQHCLTIPREIGLGKNGKLVQKPLKEFDSLRKSGRTIHESERMKVTLPFELDGEIIDHFSLNFDHKLIFSYDKNNMLFEMKFRDQDYGCGRTTRKAPLDNPEKLRMLVDMSSIEIYLNNGETVLSTRFYPDEENVFLEIEGFEGNMYQL